MEDTHALVVTGMQQWKDADWAEEAESFNRLECLSHEV